MQPLLCFYITNDLSLASLCFPDVVEYRKSQIEETRWVANELFILRAANLVGFTNIQATSPLHDLHAIFGAPRKSGIQRRCTGPQAHTVAMSND